MVKNTEIFVWLAHNCGNRKLIVVQSGIEYEERVEEMPVFYRTAWRLSWKDRVGAGRIGLDWIEPKWQDQIGPDHTAWLEPGKI